MVWNTHRSWGWPARTLHWLIAVMVLMLAALGMRMTDLPEAERPYWYTVHASIGVTLLAVMALRLVWRLFNVVPALPDGLPSWQRLAARATHRLLYALAFATALVGWLLAGTFEDPVRPMLFGLVPVPLLLDAGSPWNETLAETHGALAFTLLALVLVHAGAALYHHLVLRDDVLRRMLAG